jgi:hypothetical protein
MYCYAECHYAEYRYAECHYAECRYAECRYSERRQRFRIGRKYLTVTYAPVYRINPFENRLIRRGRKNRFLFSGQIEKVKHLFSNKPPRRSYKTFRQF